jgi:ParB family transcriptional regulator, chromosome partitioning protein
MAKARGLGRGLDALLGGEEQTVAAGEALRDLAVDALQPGKYQPRTRMDPEALKELAVSLQAQGLMQPILVRPIADGRYEIVAGERRWRAARIAGFATVPALVREVPDRQALEAALVENIQREDLNPLEEAAGILRLIQEFGMTHQHIAETLGRSRTAVTNLLRLLELAPAVRELLASGELDVGHARALLALPAEDQIRLAREVAAKRLSVREVENRVGSALKRPMTRGRPRPDRDIQRLEEEWSNRLGTTVMIKTGAKKGSGKLVISYSSLDQLDTLLARLTQSG